MIPPTFRLDIWPGCEGCVVTILIAGEQMHRMLPELSYIHQGVVAILAVEEDRRPVQVLETKEIVDYFLDDNAWHAIIIAGCQQSFHHGLAFASRDDDSLTLRTRFPGRMGAVTAIDKQIEPLHELRREIVAEKR